MSIHQISITIFFNYKKNPFAIHQLTYIVEEKKIVRESTKATSTKKSRTKESLLLSPEPSSVSLERKERFNEPAICRQRTFFRYLFWACMSWANNYHRSPLSLKLLEIYPSR
jgi:hypothetical protein